MLQTWLFCYLISFKVSTKEHNFAVLSSFKLDLIVTIGSINVMFLELAKASLISFAAIGAQEPFSIMAIL